MDKQTEIQDNAVEEALKFYEFKNQGFANLSVRFGKCRFAIEILKQLIPIHGTVLIAYPDNNIKASWEGELEVWRYDNPNITFTNFSSLFKYKDKIFDFFIIDEFHAASINEMDYCHQIMTNDKKTYTLALSGTVSKNTERRWGLKEIVKFSTNEGIEEEILADYKITVHTVALDTKIKTPNKKGKLLSEKQKYDNYTYIIEKFKNEGKDSMFLLLSRNRLSTGSIAKNKYAKELLKTLNNKRILVFAGLTEAADNLDIPSYHSKSSNDNFERFQKGEINQLALASMGKMGVTFKDLDGVVLLNATHNAEETAQILGRASKLDYEGKVAEIHIITLKEEPEIKKIKNTLAMLDKSKITYV